MNFTELKTIIVTNNHCYGQSAPFGGHLSRGSRFLWLRRNPRVPNNPTLHMDDTSCMNGESALQSSVRDAVAEVPSVVTATEKSADSEPNPVTDTTQNCFSCAAEGDKIPAVYECCTCAERRVFCEPHATAHHASKGHAIPRISPPASTFSAVVSEHITCSTHVGFACHLFCVDHSKLLCTECCVRDHPPSSHKVKRLDTLTDYFRERINDSMPELVRHSAAVTEASVCVQQQPRVIAEHTKAILDRIDADGAWLHSVVDEAVNEARARTLRLQQTCVSAVEASAGELASASQQLANVHGLCVDALAQGSAASLANALQVLEARRALLAPITVASPPMFELATRVDAVTHAASTGTRLLRNLR